MEDKLFYVAQKAFIRNGDKVLVLIKKKGAVDAIDFPGGKVQVKEINYLDSFKREVTEETGLDFEVDKPFHIWSFDLPESHKNFGNSVFVIGYICNYMGGEISISDEHVNYVWINRDDFLRLDSGGPFYEALKVYFDNL